MRCPPCADANARTARAHRGKLKRRGMCFACGGEKGADGTRNFCRPCAERAYERDRRERERRKAAGLCTRCARPSGGYVQCLAHRSEKAAAGVKRRAGKRKVERTARYF